jgi:type II secretory pathway component PulJ
MLTLLLKLKSLASTLPIFIAIAALLYGCYWHGQYKKSQAIIAQQYQTIATCQASQQLLESAVQRWKAAAAQYDKQLKRKEALVAKRTAESDKRIKTILQTQYSSDCNQAIQQGIQQASYVKFNWHNDTP